MKIDETINTLTWAISITEVMLEHIQTYLSLDRDTGGDPAEPTMDPAKK